MPKTFANKDVHYIILENCDSFNPGHKGFFWENCKEMFGGNLWKLRQALRRWILSHKNFFAKFLWCRLRCTISQSPLSLNMHKTFSEQVYSILVNPNKLWRILGKYNLSNRGLLYTIRRLKGLPIGPNLCPNFCEVLLGL